MVAMTRKVGPFVRMPAPSALSKDFAAWLPRGFRDAIVGPRPDGTFPPLASSKLNGCVWMRADVANCLLTEKADAESAVRRWIGESYAGVIVIDARNTLVSNEWLSKVSASINSGCPKACIAYAGEPLNASNISRVNWRSSFASRMFLDSSLEQVVELISSTHIQALVPEIRPWTFVSRSEYDNMLCWLPQMFDLAGGINLSGVTWLPSLDPQRSPADFYPEADWKNYCFGVLRFFGDRALMHTDATQRPTMMDPKQYWAPLEALRAIALSM